jgi:AcrR family transcriptional regulator
MIASPKPMPATTQRTLQREETRRQLVEAGLRVVTSHGFAGATTATIARETGKAHGTVFLHFPTREALVAEMIAEVGRAMSLALAAQDSHQPTLAQVMDAHLQALAHKEALYARILGEAATLPLSGVASRLRAAYARSPKGSVREIEPVALANIWISLTNHYLLNRDLFAPGGSVIATRGHEIRQQVLSLILL